MAKPSIFIASSGRAKVLGEQLQLELQLSQEFSQVWFWSEDSRRNPGTKITDRLKERAGQCDFAAVVLTEDDLTLKKGNTYRVPRDNCIFEAGFFTSALGFDFQRCFLIYGGRDPQGLPSDLQEIQHISFSEPNLDGMDEREARKKAREALHDVFPIIRSKVEEKGTLDRPPVARLISKDDLIELERPGKNLTFGAVVVNSTQPLERGYAFAMRVMLNMKAEVDYKYFFHADESSAYPILHMIQMLSLASLFEPGTTELTLDERLLLMAAKKEDVVRNLDTVADRLSIHFLPDKSPVEFCVHNADSNTDAKCYLKYSHQYFLEWHHDHPSEAKAVAWELLRYCKNQKRAIFRSTRDFILDTSQQFRDTFYDAIDRYFVSDLRPAVADLCFGKGAPPRSKIDVLRGTPPAAPKD